MRLRIVIFILIISSIVVSAQTNAPDTTEQVLPPKVKQFVPPVFRGASVHFDIASPIFGALDRTVNLEIQADVNLYRRLYPIIEVGFTSINRQTPTGASYSSHSPFFRLGINYGLLKPFKDDGSMRSVKCYPFVGIRYAFSTMNYTIENLAINDDYWGKQETMSYHSPLTYTGWLEVVAGVRVDLYRGLTMGWSVRLKTLIHTSAPDKAYVWYVPGYSRSQGMAFSFNYTIGYTFYTGDSNTKTQKI